MTSAKQSGGWRPHRGQQSQQFRGSFFLLVGEYLLNKRRIFNTGNDVHGSMNAASAGMRKSGDLHRTAAIIAGRDVDVEDALESLCTYSRYKPPFRRRAVSPHRCRHLGRRSLRLANRLWVASRGPNPPRRRVRRQAFSGHPAARPASTLATPQRHSPRSSYRWVILLSRTAALARRPARRPPGGFGRDCIRIEIGQLFPDHRGVFNAGDDPQRHTAGRAGLDIDAEYRFRRCSRVTREATYTTD
jgi:hypothetical protein